MGCGCADCERDVQGNSCFTSVEGVGGGGSADRFGSTIRLQFLSVNSKRNDVKNAPSSVQVLQVTVPPRLLEHEVEVLMHLRDFLEVVRHLESLHV